MARSTMPLDPIKTTVKGIPIETAVDDLGTPTPPTANGDRATPEEIATLFHVVDDIPPTVWLASLAAASERFAWYGATSPLQNYLQNARGGALPGVFGLGEGAATLVLNGFQAFAFFTPIPGAIVADAWLGRYKTMLVSSVLCIIATILLLVTSLPPLLQLSDAIPGAGLGAFMILFALGSGGMRAASTAFIADQYTSHTPHIATLRSGERVVTDRELTVQYIYNAYFWLVNMAGLVGLATTFIERYVGFWAAFVLPVAGISLGILPLLLCGRRFAKNAPSGALLVRAARVLLTAARRGFRLDAAKPSPADEDGEGARFVDELKLAMLACGILAFFPVHWLVLQQTFTNLIAQAGQMVGSGVPNDAIKSIMPLSALVLYPLVQRGLYPLLRQRGVPFGSVARITVGFALLTASMAYAAGLQRMIYTRAPCYEFPLQCEAAMGGTVPNQISMFLQVPIYIVNISGEILCLPSATEHAYNQAPKGMRSIVQAVSLAMAGAGCLLCMALNPLAANPHLVVLFSVVAGLMGATTMAFWVCFRRLDKMELTAL